MAIDAKLSAKAKDALEARLGKNTEIVEYNNKEEKIAAAEKCGQMNASALTDGEYATFYPVADYEKDPDSFQITEYTSPRTGNTSTNLYVLVKRFFKNGAKEVAIRHEMINVGGIVRRHYDLNGLDKDENGKIVGARRVLDPGKFNEALEGYKSPWNMLQYLGGKTIQAKRSDKKYFFQKFVQGQPVQDEYVEQYAMEYGFAK